MAPTAQRSYSFITDCLEQLGLETYGKERQDPKTTIRRPVFNYAPVADLYYLELSYLFGLLLRDKLDRDDPRLFEDEFDYLLVTYGPLIWPQPGQGSRDHLRQPKSGTLYTSHLVYPRDSVKLKQGLRGMILGRKVRPDVKVKNLINENSKMGAFENSQSESSCSSQKRQSSKQSTSATSKINASDKGNTTNYVSEDSDIGAKTRRQTGMKRKASSEMTFAVELRLYRVTTEINFLSPGPVWPYGSIFISDDCATSDDCFSRICDQIETDCSFMIFQLPEHMTRESRIRIDRGSRESERIFQDVLGIFQKAKRFPGEPQHHSVEVEVGLEMPSDD